MKRNYLKVRKRDWKQKSNDGTLVDKMNTEVEETCMAVELWDSTSIREDNETFFIRV